MIFIPTVNPIMEALAYLCKRANSDEPLDALKRIEKQGVHTGELAKRSDMLIDLYACLDSSIQIDEARLSLLFGGYEGFPARRLGVYSTANILIEPFAVEFDGSLENFLEQMLSVTPSHRRYNMMCATMLNGQYVDHEQITERRFLNYALELNIPSDVKLAIIDAYSNADAYIEEALGLIERVVEVIDAQSDCFDFYIASLSEEFSNEQERNSLLQNLTSVDITACQTLKVFPSVLGYDRLTALCTPNLAERDEVYCYIGVLLKQFADLKKRGLDDKTAICGIIKTLADQSRLDILCRLSETPAYGQELSEKSGLSRNTVYHHLNKLQNIGFVNYKMDGNRTYYSTNKPQVYRFLQRQKELLLGNWTPKEDEE